MRPFRILPRLRVAGFSPRVEQKKTPPTAPKVDTTTKVYAARQLLALGPLTFGEFLEITGWQFKTCRRVLSYLVDDLGEVSRLGRMYQMTNGKQLPNVHPLATEGRPSNGKAPSSPLRSSPEMGIPTATSDVREAKAGCCGRCSREGCMEQQGVSS